MKALTVLVIVVLFSFMVVKVNGMPFQNVYSSSNVNSTNLNGTKLCILASNTTLSFGGNGSIAFGCKCTGCVREPDGSTTCDSCIC